MSQEILSLAQKFSITQLSKQVDSCRVTFEFKEECLKLQELATNHAKLLKQLMSGNIKNSGEIGSIFSDFYFHLAEEVILTKDNIDTFAEAELKYIFKTLKYKYILNQSLMQSLSRFV